MPLTTLDPTQALVVIDLQKGIVSGAIARVVPNAASLAKSFRQHDLPVVLVNVTGRAPGRTDTGAARGTSGPFPAGWTALHRARLPQARRDRDHRPDHRVPRPQVEGDEAMPANPLGVALRNRRAGHHTLVWARPDLQAPENFTLTSPAFDHGEPIPEKHRGRLLRANSSPALSWTPPPAGTVELVLIVQDPDVPFGKPATHALTLGIDPSLDGIPENALTDPSPIPGIRHGKGALGRRGWAGPMPPKSHGPHAYVFQLFALDQAPGLPASFTLNDVIAAINGHVIGRARLDGTYEIS